MTEAELRKRVEALGLALDPRAFAAALQGAQHLRAEVARVKAYLERPEP
ncbi:hypothetical protein [Neogemmobacter tilapiae]|uniref:Uncharacterized protein n=1 Tax=Neogemmobacter tilapiae TaxID=875041 RepID=A0A918WKN5_9RHOB|nr:hypothetical protein [Gemmobacter tilapiae]GHC60201.1 hypothetical protein GCM10007315_25190 [Gemmobacter tilapiae]